MGRRPTPKKKSKSESSYKNATKVSTPCKYCTSHWWCEYNIYLEIAKPLAKRVYLYFNSVIQLDHLI